jgi:hypothetical protein
VEHLDDAGVVVFRQLPDVEEGLKELAGGDVGDRSAMLVQMRMLRLAHAQDARHDALEPDTALPPALAHALPHCLTAACAIFALKKMTAPHGNCAARCLD